MQRSASLFLLILCISAFIRCTYGIEGDDTIPADKAAGMLAQAAFVRYLSCHPPSSSSTDFSSSLGLTRVGCVGASNEDQLLRKSDVLACREVLLAIPCSSNSLLTSIVLNTAALSCAAESVPFLINNVSPPTQGSIISMGSGNESGSVFYFNCF